MAKAIAVATSFVSFIGIDPGTKGAIACLNLEKRLLEIHDLPFVDVKRGRAKAVTELNEVEVAAWIRDWSVEARGLSVGAIEIQGVRPARFGDDGKPLPGFHGNIATTATQQRTYGQCRGLMTGCGLPYDPITASEWQKVTSAGADPDVARAAGQRMFPRAASAFSGGRCRIDRIEAALIAASAAIRRGVVIPSDIELVARQTRRAA